MKKINKLKLTARISYFSMCAKMIEFPILNYVCRYKPTKRSVQMTIDRTLAPGNLLNLLNQLIVDNTSFSLRIFDYNRPTHNKDIPLLTCRYATRLDIDNNPNRNWFSVIGFFNTIIETTEEFNKPKKVKKNPKPKVTVQEATSHNETPELVFDLTDSKPIATEEQIRNAENLLAGVMESSREAIRRMGKEIGEGIEREIMGINKPPHFKPIAAKPALYAIYYEPLKLIAAGCGYNLLIHGSLNRDMDLVAVPWQNSPSSHLELLHGFCDYFGVTKLDDAKDYMHNVLPGGRDAYVINLNRGKFSEHHDPQYYVDISITPLVIK